MRFTVCVMSHEIEISLVFDIFRQTVNKTYKYLLITELNSLSSLRANISTNKTKKTPEKKKKKKKEGKIKTRLKKTKKLRQD